MRVLIAMMMAGALCACATSEPPLPEPAPAPQPVVTQPPVTKDPATGKISMPAGADVPIDAPKAGAVALDLKKEDAGKSFSMKVGQRVSVSLVGVPTAGYVWAAPNPPKFLQVAGQSSGPTHSDQLKPGFAGGNHWEVTTFVATAPGKGVLTFEQRRPWETKEPPVDTWSATIEVK